MIALVRYRVEERGEHQNEEIPIPEEARNDEGARRAVVSDFLQDKHKKAVNYFHVEDYLIPMTEEEKRNICATLGCSDKPKRGYPHCEAHILYHDKPDFKKYK